MTPKGSMMGRLGELGVARSLGFNLAGIRGSVTFQERFVSLYVAATVLFYC